MQEKSGNAWLASLGLRLSDWFERWFPDAFALALAAVAIVFAVHVPLVLFLVWALNTRSSANSRST